MGKPEKRCWNAIPLSPTIAGLLSKFFNNRLKRNGKSLGKEYLTQKSVQAITDFLNHFWQAIFNLISLGILAAG